jgi:hypothetical protein
MGVENIKLPVSSLNFEKQNLTQETKAIFEI